MCSSVIKVTVELEKGITNMELFGLLRLQNFWELSINGVKWEEKITFDGGVAPLLMAFGTKSLTSLKLKNLEMKIDIGVILETCPLLSTLSLKNINLKQPERFGIRRILPKLKFLCLSGDDEHDLFPSYYLTSLLSSPDLCEVDINYVRALTDQVLFDAASHNQFSKLELLKIALADSDTVTKKGIDLFLKNTNILKKIILRECDSIKQKDVVEWKSLIITNNWQLVLEIVYPISLNYPMISMIFSEPTKSIVCLIFIYILFNAQSMLQCTNSLSNCQIAVKYILRKIKDISDYETKMHLS